MKVVNYNQAAKKAGVSRQCIQNMKKLNQDKKKSYPFFMYDPDTGKHGINIDDITWKKYVDKYNSKRVNKTPTPNNTDSKSNHGEIDNNTRFDNLIQATYFIIVERFKLTDKEIRKLMGDINKRFEGMG